MQFAVEAHTLCREAVQTVDNIRINLKIESVAGVLAALDSRRVVINIRVFLAGENWVLKQVFTPRFVVGLINLQLSGDVLNGALHLRQHLAPVAVKSGFHLDIQRVNIVQLNHKIAVIELEIASVEGKQTGFNGAAKIETQILLNQNLLIAWVEGYVLALAHTNLRHALYGQIHVIEIKNGVHRARCRLRLKVNQVVVDTVNNAVEVAVEFRLHAAIFSFRVIIHYSFVSQRYKQPLGCHQTLTDKFRKFFGIELVQPCSLHIVAELDVRVNVLKPLVFVVTLGAEVILRFEFGGTDATADDVCKVDFGVVHLPAQLSEVHFHIVIRVVVRASRHVLRVVIANQVELLAVIIVFQRQTRMINRVAVDADIDFCVGRCESFFADTEIFRIGLKELLLLNHGVALFIDVLNIAHDGYSGRLGACTGSGNLVAHDCETTVVMDVLKKVFDVEGFLVGTELRVRHNFCASGFHYFIGYGAHKRIVEIS